MSDGSPPYLASLNPEQLAAVVHEGRSLLILAGAGSGKTRVITTKIAYLVRERAFQPESILAVTFTNKAAREMRDRAASIESACSRAVMRTFHSFGAWFLRRNAAAAGLSPDFTIYDDDDSTTLLHGALPQNSRAECSRMAQAIARAKDYGLEPDSPDLSLAFADPGMRRVYALYEERLRATRNVDFGDLIRLPARLLRDDSVIRRRTRQRFRVVLVDEYQDSNVAQFELLRLLAGEWEAEAGDPGARPYACVVGDDDQSIYRFRGAEIRNILRFPELFPGTDIVKLERNYRSYQSILDVAGDVVSRNAGRLGKRLVAERAGGSKPRLVRLDDQDAEVAYCAALCRDRKKAGGSWGDVAILYRTNAQSLGFEKEFARLAIPYRLVGASRFYDREEVKDELAYLALLANGYDEVAFKRVVNKPSRGIGETSVESILAIAARGGAGFLEAAAAAAAGDELRGKARSGLRDFLAALAEVRAALDAPAKDGDTLAAVVQLAAARSGLAQHHRGQDEVAGTQRAANLDELANAASLYPRSREGLSEFLETIELDRSLSREDDARDAVTLITMHNTKGLEFPVVVATGLEQGLFPRDDEEGEELEEQRRLFYVAITRAKDELHLTTCRWRRLHGRLFETAPSRFLSEVEPSRLEGFRATRSDGSRASPSAYAPSANRYGGSSGAYGGVYGGVYGGAYGGARGGAQGRPSGANESLPGRGSLPAASAPRSGAAAPWRAGQAVYHDDYGAGAVIKVSPTPSSGPLVVVRFETGKQAQFFPKFTTKLEIQGS